MAPKLAGDKLRKLAVQSSTESTSSIPVRKPAKKSAAKAGKGGGKSKAKAKAKSKGAGKAPMFFLCRLAVGILL
jgi:hypothetical protein